MNFVLIALSILYPLSISTSFYYLFVYLIYLARILQHVKTTLESSTVPWDDLDILDVLHKERERLGVKVGVFMRTLRWGVTGMKVRFGVFRVCLDFFLILIWFTLWLTSHLDL